MSRSGSDHDDLPRRRRWEPRPPRRRGPTRWLIVTPLVGLAVVIAGVWALEAAAPVVDPGDQFEVEVPPLGLPDETECLRRADDDGAADVRAEFRSGERVSSTQVHLCPAAFDEREVTYVGEVVGELLPREGGVWAWVNDDDYALRTGPLVGHRERAGFNTGLAVWLPDGLHEEIDAPGRPGRRGDVIKVRGELLRTDPDDGGGTTIRAEQLDVLAEAVEIDDPLHVPQAIAAGLLTLGAAATLVWSRRARRR
jgi:hypothetical protein